MARKTRNGLGDVGPFGKAFAPPKIIFGNRVKLWEIKGNEPNERVGWWKQTLIIPFILGAWGRIRGDLLKESQWHRSGLFSVRRAI